MDSNVDADLPCQLLENSVTRQELRIRIRKRVQKYSGFLKKNQPGGFFGFWVLLVFCEFFFYFNEQC